MSAPKQKRRKIQQKTTTDDGKEDALYLILVAHLPDVLANLTAEYASGPWISPSVRTTIQSVPETATGVALGKDIVFTCTAPRVISAFPLDSRPIFQFEVKGTKVDWIQSDDEELFVFLENETVSVHDLSSGTWLRTMVIPPVIDHSIVCTYVKDTIMIERTDGKSITMHEYDKRNCLPIRSWLVYHRVFAGCPILVTMEHIYMTNSKEEYKKLFIHARDGRLVSILQLGNIKPNCFAVWENELYIHDSKTNMFHIYNLDTKKQIGLWRNEDFDDLSSIALSEKGDLVCLRSGYIEVF